jgi:ectoine hydroxylase-related dioxygenase (phytanoyl-CoA dioxygenase family)
MMTDEQRFLFDLQGYLLVPGVLDGATIARMLAQMDAHSVNPPEDGGDDYRFGDFLQWSEDYRNLVDHPTLLPILAELLGPKFRLDHAYGMATRPGKGATSQPSGYTLHHTAGMFEHGCYYVTHGSRMHNGLIVVSWALSDIAPGAGGFCCIPGSHKAMFPMPRRLFQIDGNPLVRQVPQKAGDVVIFTEALTHGTWPWTDPNGQRRSVLLKYAPHYMQWGQKPMDADAVPGLSERQRLLLEGAYVWQRPALPQTDAQPMARP